MHIPWHIQTHSKSNTLSQNLCNVLKYTEYRSINFLSASIIVVESQTLMSSCVLKRVKSCFDLRTAKMGNRSSWQTVSQKSRGNEAP